MYLPSIFDIPLLKLKSDGIKGLIFDIDNTLAPYYISNADKKTIAFINDATALGFKVCLLSNNSKKRVTLFNRDIKVNAVHWALKPFRKGLRKAMMLMGTNKSSTVIIGDQIFTDVLCGKRAGLYTILVAPIAQKDQWMTKIKRGIERKIIRFYEKEVSKNE